MIQKLILIGASTGGPGHLKKILCSLGKNFKTPIVIAQHMNRSFMESFVKQFDSELPYNVVLVDSTHYIERSYIYICAKHTQLAKELDDIQLECLDNIVSVFNPSVEHLFQSAVPLVDKVQIMAVLLTGIGADGANALSNLQNAGALCIAESEKTAIVYGMPKRALELNSKIKSMDLEDIIEKIKQFGEV